MNGFELREIPTMTMHLESALPRIIAVQGASRHLIQALLSQLASTWRGGGLQIAGAVEEFVYEPGTGRETVVLRDLKTGARFRIKQDLGPGSVSCALDAAGLAGACAAIEVAIEAGCDLAIISKFGKLEAERSGLSGAFHAAIAAGIPVVTSVAPSMTEAWNAFANPLAMFAEPDFDAIENWLQKLTQANVSSIAYA
jgi:Protein of unknown function (DUF2478)